MSLLRQLRDATNATEQPLTAVLRKAMILAGLLQNPPLHQWARSELNGYPDGASLPSYRHSRPVAVRGHFIVYGRPEVIPVPISVNPIDPPEDPPPLVHVPVEAQLDDVLIAPDRVQSADRLGLFTHQFRQPVAVYEDWLRTQTSDLRIPWPREALDRYRTELRPGASCQDACQVLSRADLIGVVDGIRNGLLEFVLELEREAPTDEDGALSEFAVAQERVTQMIITTIYAGVTMEQPINVHGGTIGNLSGGRENVVQQGDVSITQQGTDLGALLADLRGAVEQLDGQLPAEQLDATRDLVEDLEEDAAEPQPVPDRMRRKLNGIKAIARAAGSAGAAVIDAVQAIQRALGS